MITTHNTIVSNQFTFQGLDGQTWKKLVISWNNPAFEPGQFLMVERFLPGQNAPAPSALTIQDIAPDGFEVLVHPNSPLYSLDKGDGVVVWGPCGRRAPIACDYTLLTDDAGSILVAPLANKMNDCQNIYVLGKAQSAKQVFRSNPVHRISSFDEIPDLSNANLLVVALPLELMAQWKRQVSSQLEQKSVVFVGAKVGCGIGACRGCFIHSKDDPCGIPVCQCGPFMPLKDIDYAKDQNSLGHYV